MLPSFRETLHSGERLISRESLVTGRPSHGAELKPGAIGRDQYRVVGLPFSDGDPYAVLAVR